MISARSMPYRSLCRSMPCRSIGRAPLQLATPLTTDLLVSSPCKLVPLQSKMISARSMPYRSLCRSVPCRSLCRSMPCRSLCRSMPYSSLCRSMCSTATTNKTLDSVEAVSVDNNILGYLTLAYLSVKYENRDRQRAVMHLTNQGLSNAQLDTLLSSCRKLKDLLSKKRVVIGSAVRAEFYRSPAHRYGRWPTVEELGVQCLGKPMTRQLEKSVLDRIPNCLDNIIKELNKNDDSSANDYMAVVRMLTSENKHNVKLVQNDIIIYLETATLPFNTALMLTNDNLFYNSIGRYPVVLKTIVECACEAVRAYNNSHKESLTYKFKEFPVFSLLDIINDFPGLYIFEKRVNYW